MMTTAASPIGFVQPDSLLFPRSKFFDKTRSSRTKWVYSSSASSSETFCRTASAQVIQEGVFDGSSVENWKKKKKKRVFLLDVNPLCYEGSKPSSHAFVHWVTLFFSQVSLNDPVIAVLDGEQGNQQRRELLPSYKAHRRSPVSGRYTRGLTVMPNQFANDVLGRCNVPVVRIKGHEADDVVATLAEQAVQRGHRVVIASPDKDFKQLISEDVQIVMPVAELGRWSFYTLKHYHAQYNCDPQSDLSLRCIMGDEVDGVPGIQHVVPGFGKKTAMKLVKKHGSLENLLSAASVRTVGKPYAQEALTKHADYLRRNYQVLALRRDVNIRIQEEWLVERDTSNDSEVLSSLF
ncbi:PREDICTED: uncharacterized protein LOC104806782 [Tarenaya hassleriana]|uniref:uncharacterized protein LOC104806782 n=1 Tax=Tarenaya hassleriana TaxID=28532 RepID=UPI00053C1EE6|nr:PREDICTED: uncharacterized protein LOC104806782 [Tarenaya hassleriana]